METLLQRCITHGQEQVSIYHGQAGQMNQDVDKCFLTEFLLRRTNCVDWVLSHWSIINFIQKYSLWSFSWLIAVVFWFCGMVQLKEVSSSSATVFLPLFSVTWQFFYCRTEKTWQPASFREPTLPESLWFSHSWFYSSQPWNVPFPA